MEANEVFGKKREARQEALLDLIRDELVPAQQAMLERWAVALTELEQLNMEAEDER